MHNLTKQLSFLLLSCLILSFSEESKADYTFPFVPIYSKGDSLEYAYPKPVIIYEDVAETKIIIDGMPAYKTQDSLGECRAFSLATLVQKYTCDKWKSDIPDCKNPPSDSAISYFGMMAYTNRSIEEGKTFQPNQDKARNIVEIINDLSKYGNKLILESCKPFDQLVNSFDPSTESGLSKKSKFFNYLRELYEKNSTRTEADILDCPECMAKVKDNYGLDVNLINLKKALQKNDKSFDKFLYTLFFDECKMESFPVGFTAAAYPSDSMNVTADDLKNQVIKGLKLAKPVLFSGLCVSGDKGDECTQSHSLVIAGYKKVCVLGSTTNCKNLFKLHNSWGAEWQRINNDGWVDADTLMRNSSKVQTKAGIRNESASVIWLN